MIIKNGLVWEESGSFLTKDLHIDSDTHRIAMDAADTADDTIIDASGLYVIPGLVDIHIHGAMGCDFSDGSAEGLLKIAKYLRSNLHDFTGKPVADSLCIDARNSR